MNNQNKKLSNKNMQQAISLAIKIKDQHDKSKKNPRDNSALQSDLNNELCVESGIVRTCLLYTSPSPRDRTRSRMPSSA